MSSYIDSNQLDETDVDRLKDKMMSCLHDSRGDDDDSEQEDEDED